MMRLTIPTTARSSCRSSRRTARCGRASISIKMEIVDDEDEEGVGLEELLRIDEMKVEYFQVEEARRPRHRCLEGVVVRGSGK